MRACWSLWPLLGVVLATTPAAAHLGGAEGVLPFVDGGVLIGGGTTWGVIGDDGGAFAQTCEEAIGDVPRDFVRVVGEDGGELLLAATGLGVMTTVDGGCSWRPAQGTDGHSIAALTASPVGAHLWALTDDVTADDTDGNAILRSDDGGATFAAQQTFPGVRLTSLAIGASRDSPGELLLVAGVDVDSRRPLLFAGDDRGVTALTGVPLDGAQLARALAVDDDAIWFSTLDGIGRGHLFIVPRTADDMTLADAVEVGAFDGLVRATAAIAGIRFATAAGSVLFSAPDTGANIVPSAWQRSADGPLECLRRVDGDDGLWGCGRQSSGAWFKRTVDGVTWTALLPFDTVADRQCPATTPAAEACAYRFEPPGDDDDDGDDNADDDVAPNGDDDGPSCRQAGAPWASVLLILRRRRRRQR